MSGSLVQIMRYRVVCPACDNSFPNFEIFVHHILKDHADQPALRMKARIVRD
jgi:hypothetical protein